MRDAPHILGQLPSALTSVVTVTDELCIYWPHLAEHECTFKVGMDIHIYGHSSYNQKEVCSLTKNIKTWVKQTKACRAFLTNQIYSKQLWVLCYWTKHRTEGSAPLSCGHCERFDKLGGLQEETNKNDSESQSLEQRPQNSVNSTVVTFNLMSRWMNNLKTSHLYKYYKSINSIK